MFFIVNKTKQTIVLGDLKVTLGPRQAIDLDKIMPRSKSDASRDLRMATKVGQVEIRSRDDPNTKIIKSVSGDAPSPTPAPDLGKMKDEIIGEMKSAMAELMAGQQPSGMSQDDIDQLKTVLLQAIPANTGPVAQEQIKPQDEEVEMSEDILGEINKRAMDKMVKNAESKEVKYKEEKQKDNLMNNIDELEQLLG